MIWNQLIQQHVQTLVLVLVLVRCWAWRWHCVVTIAVSGVTTSVSSSSCSEDSELQSSQLSVGCRAGPRVDSDRPIRTVHLRIRPIREETMKSTNQQKRQMLCTGKYLTYDLCSTLIFSLHSGCFCQFTVLFFLKTPDRKPPEPPENHQNPQNRPFKTSNTNKYKKKQTECVPHVFLMSSSCNRVCSCSL